MKNIFINYRMADTYEAAENLQFVLEAAFSNVRVFKDTNSLSVGEDLPSRIRNEIMSADVILALIDEKWLKHEHPMDQDLNRLEYEKDWVRIELELADEYHKDVIPVLYGRGHLPSPEACAKRLPPKLRFLSNHTLAHHIRKESPGSDRDKLLEILEQRYKLLRRPTTAFAALESARKSPLLSILDATFPLNELSSPASDSPFVGLKPFREQDSPIFYGRSREIFDICYRIARTESCRLLLLEGYSGTGKSSLLQAGILPRLRGQGWAPSYVRREEGPNSGLKGAVERARSQSARLSGRPLLIIDQVEEAWTHQSASTDEVSELLVDVGRVLIEDVDVKLILAYRSEYSARFIALLKQMRMEFEQYVLLPLGVSGAIEAIQSVSQDDRINQTYGLRFEDHEIPAWIAERLLRSRDSFYVAPLLQVNMQVLWNGALRLRSRPTSDVIITWAQLNDNDSLMGEYEEVLDHYLVLLRERVGEAFDEKSVLRLLDVFIEDAPTAATRLASEISDLTGEISEADLLLSKMKELYILSDIKGEALATRLTHDILARLVRPRYHKLLEAENLRFARENLNRLKDQFAENVLRLQWDAAESVLRDMVSSDLPQEKVVDCYLELAFFRSESGDDLGALDLLKQFRAAYPSSAPHPNSDPLANSDSEGRVLEELLRLGPNKIAELRARYYPTMLNVEGGLFQMGSDSETARETERPIHNVAVSGFLIAETPITYWQFAVFCNSSGRDLENYAVGWGFYGDNPAAKITWYDCVAYANWLSVKQGYHAVYEVEVPDDPKELDSRDIDWWEITNWRADGFRLPTEAEWEYAARGGTRAESYTYAGSDEIDAVAWYLDNSKDRTQAVKQKRANTLGLYDMSGNVREWCWDRWGPNYYRESPLQDPQGPLMAELGYGVLRGGSCVADPQGCRVSNRDFNFPKIGYNYYGFRPVRRLRAE